MKYCLSHLKFELPLPPYTSRCKLINLHTLQSRRIISAVTFIYDIVNGNIDCPLLLELIKFYVPVKNLRRHYTFSIDACKSNYAMNGPITRSLIEFNSIERNCCIDFH